MGVGARCGALLRLVVEAELYRLESGEGGEADEDPAAAAVRAAGSAWGGVTASSALSSALRWASVPAGIVSEFLRDGRGLWSKAALLAGYRYAFAMENSVATDYVTEKPYDALLAGSVPLYFGAPEGAALLPPASALDLRRVASGAELGAALRRLDALPPLPMLVAASGWRLRPLPAGGPFSALAFIAGRGALPPAARDQASPDDGVTTGCRVCMCVAGMFPRCAGLAAAAAGAPGAAEEVLGVPAAPDVIGPASKGDTASLGRLADPLASLSSLVTPEHGRDVARRPAAQPGMQSWWTA